MLYQLSYSPRELKFFSKINACPLAVLRRCEPQEDGSPPGNESDWQKVAAV